MKNNYIFLLLLLIMSCSELPLNEELLVNEPIAADSDAGTWSMIVLNSPSQVAVPTPGLVTAQAYLDELETIRKNQGALSSKQKETIRFWDAGAIIRWNEFARKLVARYNLPPAPNKFNEYPFPDSENPFGDPGFPFSNPPYAARAYSYFSVAQFEALKSAYYYMDLYKRSAPYQVSSDVKLIGIESGLYSYPSEAAVISSASAEMLKLFFPAAVEEITLFAADERNAALWSGKAAPSDISAGLALGKSVAQLVTARAGSDGMRNAIGNKTSWAALEQTAIDNGTIPWISQDNPKRPPMLPGFGNVKAWNLTPAQIVTERPEFPPDQLTDKFTTELEEVKYYATNMTRERQAIVHKWADGAGTYTPPGHWNDIAAEFIDRAGFSEVRAARAFALLNMALHDAAVGCWETKYFYFTPRPTQMDPKIKTATGLPNFPAYTSGHSTFSASAATVLEYLFPEEGTLFDDQAKEASLSRLYGAIHYRSDCEKGLEHGRILGNYTVQFGQNDGAD